MPTNDCTDSKNLTFSQRCGYEELPTPLKLEEVDEKARLMLLYNLYGAVEEFTNAEYAQWDPSIKTIKEPWKDILRSVHVEVFEESIDTMGPFFSAETSNDLGSTNNFVEKYKNYVLTSPFNKLFDLFEHIMRHQKCPHEFINDVARTFEKSRLAYVIDKGPPPTIMPAATEGEGRAILDAMKQLCDAKLQGAEEHLRKASDNINKGLWEDGIRESIHAVESVALQLTESGKFSVALKKLKEKIHLHPALEIGLSKLYGYASDEVRHSKRDEKKALVERDEAVLMFGTCASFASYLSRKYQSLDK